MFLSFFSNSLTSEGAEEEAKAQGEREKNELEETFSEKAVEENPQSVLDTFINACREIKRGSRHVRTMCMSSLFFIYFLLFIFVL